MIDGVFKAETADPEWQEHTLLLDAEKSWRSSDNDYLTCATALAVWQIDSIDYGPQPGRLL